MNTFVISRRGMTARVYAVLTIVSLVMSAFPVAFFVAEATAPEKVGICHATASHENPYVSQNPNESADVSGHDGHEGPVWFPGIKESWGDIIPPFDYEGGSYPGKNWDTEGQAIHKNNCEVPSQDISGSVSGTKFEDLDNDGVSREEGEPGVSGWTIRLYEVDDPWVLVDSDVTNGDGEYEFTDIPEGEYKVCEVMQDNWTQTFVTQGSTNASPGVSEEGPECQTVNIDKDGEKNTKNFGNHFTKPQKECDDGHTGIFPECVPIPLSATVHAQKVICDDEADLPNGAVSTPIDADTASDWVAAHDSCELARDWQFEWAPKGTADPGDTLTGTAGSDWTTFTGSVDVPVTAFADDGSFWMREVLQPDYIPFTHEANPDNSDDVTAEFYCHVDAKNYDNFDRIDLPLPEEDYYCVAWNVPVEKEPVACELTIVSDTTDYVVEKDADAKALSFIHSAWTAVIDGATWIWGDDPIVDPSVDETQTFEKGFGWIGDVTTATLYIASDNSHAAELNDSVAGVAVEEQNFRTTDQDEYDVTGLIEQGNNDLSIAVMNWAGNPDPEKNPAGLMYKLHIEGFVTDDDDCSVPYEPEPEEPKYGDYCGDGIVNQDWEECDPGHLIPGDELKKRELVGCSVQCQPLGEPVCTDLTLAKIDMENVSNQADGDMTDDIYLGGMTPIPNEAWFRVFEDGSYDIDPDIASYEDMPGLAVQRLAGSLRTVMHGTAEKVDIEHADGTIEFWSYEDEVGAVSIESDTSNDTPGKNDLEKPDNDVKGGPGDDEVDLVDGVVEFWLTTDVADDGFYTHYGDPVFCGVCGGDFPSENLLVNGSFEEPVVTAHGGDWEIFPAVPGWAISLSDGLELWRGLGIGPSEGEQNAELDGIDATMITQTVVTIPGATYELSFDFAARSANAEDNHIEAAVDGVSLVNVSTDNTSWTTYSATFVADESSDVSFVDLGIPQQKGGTGTLLDNAIMCQVADPIPEQGSLEITSPATDGETLSGTHAFQAEYVDEDAVQDVMRWAIRESTPTCSGGTTYAGGNISGWSDPSTFDGASFEAVVDMSTWADGEYCFVVNPDEQDSGDGSEFREFRPFILENDDTNGQEYCDDDSALNYGAEEACEYEEDEPRSSSSGGGSTKPSCRDLTLLDGMLEWDTNRGKDMSITANGVEIFTTTDDDEVDAGSLYVGLAGNVTYELTVNRYSKSDTCEVESEFLGGAGGDFPEGLVLGEQVSVVPYGAPDAGAGGAAPLEIPRTATASAIMLRNLLRVANNG